MSHLHRPVKAKSLTEGCHRQLADVIIGQLQGAFAPHRGLVVRKRGETIDLVKNAHEGMCGVETLKTAEAPWPVGQDTLAYLVRQIQLIHHCLVMRKVIGQEDCKLLCPRPTLDLIGGAYYLNLTTVPGISKMGSDEGVCVIFLSSSPARSKGVFQPAPVSFLPRFLSPRQSSTFHLCQNRDFRYTYA